MAAYGTIVLWSVCVLVLAVLYAHPVNWKETMCIISNTALQATRVVCQENSQVAIMAEQQNWAEMAKLIAQGASVNSRDQWGKTSLYYAAKVGATTWIDFLVASGAHLETCTIHGSTALMVAAANNQVEVVKQLLHYGADLHAVNCENKTALDFAESSAIISLLRSDRASNERSNPPTPCSHDKTQQDEKLWQSFVNMSIASSMELSLRMMSFNLRYGSLNDVSMIAWARRRSRVASLLRYHSPHIIALQEVLNEQLEDLKVVLSNYQFIGVGRDDGQQAGEFVPIGFRRHDWELLNTTTFWLSQTPQVAGSKSWQSSSPRIATTARLQSRTYPSIIVSVINTHLDHISAHSRLQAASLLNTEAQDGDLLILAGDFNEPVGGPSYMRLTDPQQGGLFIDAFDLSLSPPFGPSSSFCGFFKEAKSDRIDHILLSSSTRHRAQVVTAGVIDIEDKQSVLLSDHRPVVADLLISHQSI